MAAKYSIVIPCYKSSETIETVVELTNDELKGEELEFVLVNDGSPDEGKTFEAITRLVKKHDNVKGIDLAKNSGQHNAIMCALNHTNGDYIICMDDDMQTHPSQIHKLTEKIHEGYDVVYACYPSKKHGLLRNLESRISSWTVSKMIDKPTRLRTSSFWVVKRFVRDYIIQYKNSNPFIPGLIFRTTNNVINVEVEHYERKVGKSGYDFKALFKLWSNVLGFSVKPLRIASIIGAMFAMAGFLGALYAVLRSLLFDLKVVGWTSIITAICFFSGLILMFMGLIGEYMGRMFLDSGNNPQYVIRKIIHQSKLNGNT